ncbi:MAG: hypothetical protein ACTSRS_13410 [Candidatus Helarchaeota archaeon]
MKHFITKLIEGTTDTSTSRRFKKFSKGEYPDGGPVLKVKVTKNNKFTMNASFEYEDLMGYFVATHLPEGEYNLKGSIYTQPRVTLDSIEESLKFLSMSDGWEKGKRDLKNLFVYKINLNSSPQEICKVYEFLADYCYLLLNITPSKGIDWVFKSAEKIPPLKKTFGKGEPYTNCKPEKREKCKNAELCQETGICITDRIKFCKIKTPPLTEEAIKDFFKFFLPDFPQIQQSFTELLLINQYTITDFIFPEDKESLDAKELREKIKRVGYINRIVHINKTIYSNRIDFIV